MFAIKSLNRLIQRSKQRQSGEECPVCVCLVPVLAVEEVVQPVKSLCSRLLRSIWFHHSLCIHNCFISSDSMLLHELEYLIQAWF
jgi:hypothetical protein